MTRQRPEAGNQATGAGLIGLFFIQRCSIAPGSLTVTLPQRQPIWHGFLIELQKPSVLSPKRAETLLEPLVNRGNNTAYGYGWRIYETGHYKKVWHSGSTADFRSEVLLLPGTGWGAVLLTNRNNSLESYRLTQVAFGIEALLNGDEPTAVERATPVTRLIFYGLTVMAFLMVILLYRHIKRRMRKEGRINRRLWASLSALFVLLGVGLFPVLIIFTGVPWRSLHLFVPDMALLTWVIVALLLVSAGVAARLGLSEPSRQQ